MSAVKVERLEPGRYITADYWFTVERGTGHYEDHGQSSWVISLHKPPQRHEARARQFMEAMAEDRRPAGVEGGRNEEVMAAMVNSLKAAKKLMEAVGYKTLTDRRCRRCGLRVISWSKGDGATWKHATGGSRHDRRGRGRTPSHLRHDPQPIDAWEYEEIFGLAEPVKSKEEAEHA